MNTGTVTLLFVLLLSVTGFSRVADSVVVPGNIISTVEYPSWFLEPANSDLIVGFTLPDRSAKSDGYDRFCAYKRMRTKGIVRFFSDGTTLHSEDSLYFYYDPNGRAVPLSSLIPIDSCTMNGGNNIYLFRIDGASSSGETVRTDCGSLVLNSLDDSDQIFGEGVVKLGCYDHLCSWVKAESEAVRSLLKQSGVLVASLSRDSLGSSNVTDAVRYEYDLEVNDLFVKRRWVEFDSSGVGYVHVVVAASQLSVKEWNGTTDDPLSDSVVDQVKTVPGTVNDRSHDLEIWERYQLEQKAKLNDRSAW